MTDATLWHHLEVDAALQQLNTRASGLAASQVAEHRARFGRNEIARRQPISPLRLLLKQFINFFVLVLLFAAALAFAVSVLPGESERRPTAVFILGIVALSVLLSFYEEYRAQKELDALDQLLVFHARVVRDGAQQTIDAADVVPGDIRADARTKSARRRAGD